MRRLAPIAFFTLALNGCAPSVDRLVRLLEEGAFENAAASVRGDETMQAELAALVLERAAAAGEDSAGCVSILAAAGAPGRRALERLLRVEGEASRLAFVALERGSTPDDDDLGRLVADPSSDVRAAAATAWARNLRTPRLLELALDPDPRVRAAAVSGLASRPDDAAASAAVIEALRVDPDARVRAEAARCGPCLGPDALLRLGEALRDRALGVRMAAARGLGEIGGPDAAARLRDIAAGPLDEVAVAASAELCRLGEERGCVRLTESVGHRDPIVRSTALLHLERAGSRDRRERLLEALDDPSADVVLLAASMLRDEDDREAVIAALGRVARGDSPRAREALFLSAARGDPEAASEVARILESGDEDERVAALSGAGRCRLLLDRFADLLGSPSDRVRLAAARAVLLAADF